jgi:GTP pyrophosphokinase
MNETAEYGMAAHWAYKFNLKKEEFEKNMDWVGKIAKMQNDIPNSTEFLGFLHESLLPEDSYAWTPKGEKISFPIGATILDFAFAIHTDLGLHCLGARSTDKVFSIDSAIPTGETIHILHSDSQEPQETWLSMVKTQKAQNAIRYWLRKAAVKQFEALGRRIWQREIQNLKISKRNFPSEKNICEAFKTQDMSSFYESLGKNEILIKDILDFLKSYSDSSIWSKFKFSNVFSSAENTSANRDIKCILQVEAKGRVSIEEDIFKTISMHNALVKKTIFNSKEGLTKGRIDVLVFNSAQIMNIEQSLRAVAGIRKVKIL